jgi:hypothetical protein
LEDEYESAMEEDSTIPASLSQRPFCAPSPDPIFAPDDAFVRQMLVLQASFLSLAAFLD